MGEDRVADIPVQRKVAMYSGFGQGLGMSGMVYQAWETMRRASITNCPAYAVKMDGTTFKFHPGRFTSFSDWFYFGL